MATIVNTALAGFTVDYNGVQLGGSDATVQGSTYGCFPPQYQLTAEPVWDESHRAITAISCYLKVVMSCFAANEAAMGLTMRGLRTALEQPGKTLKLSGLGSGFDWINPPVGRAGDRTGDMLDIIGGPYPDPLIQIPTGQLNWELNWGIRFTVSTCAPFAFDPLAFVSFNFSTTWRNDFEGYSSRVIQGKVTIPYTRDQASPKTILHVAEETRGNILVLVPDGFRRMENTWHEGNDHHSLEFTIVDQQLQGDPYPAGITQADGNFSINFGSKEGNAMNKAVASFNCTLKTAYNQPKNLAESVFIAMVLSKQSAMVTQQNALRAAAVTANPTNPTVPVGTLLPLGFAMQHGKFDSARTFQGSVSWLLVQDFNSLLTACNISAPVGDTAVAGGIAQDYSTWKTSMNPLWGNRGVTFLNELPGEAVVIDLCDNKTNITIGSVGSNPNNPPNAGLSSLTCPDVSANGGWIHFDLDIKLLREEQVSIHNMAATYIANIGISAYNYLNQPNTGNGTAVGVGGSSYSQSPGTLQAIEYHGNPKFYVGLTFVGMRFKYTPFVPEINSVGNMAVRLHSQSIDTPKHVADSFGCPIWSVSGYRVYSVPGYVASLKPVSSLTAADTNIPLDL